jgi:hypothetical protein
MLAVAKLVLVAQMQDRVAQVSPSSYEKRREFVLHRFVKRTRRCRAASLLPELFGSRVDEDDIVVVVVILLSNLYETMVGLIPARPVDGSPDSHLVTVAMRLQQMFDNKHGLAAHRLADECGLGDIGWTLMGRCLSLKRIEETRLISRLHDAHRANYTFIMRAKQSGYVLLLHMGI